MRTTADEKIEQAKELAKEINIKIGEMVTLFEDAIDIDCNGSSQYKDQYIDKIDYFIADSNTYKVSIRRYMRD